LRPAGVSNHDSIIAAKQQITLLWTQTPSRIEDR
jgi:hypothetical protein